MAWLIVAEVFPNELRGKATALCVQVNFGSYGLVQFAVPVLEEMIGFNGTFAIFALLSAYSVYFVKEFVPETKGMTLEDIEDKMEDTGSSRSLSTEEQMLLKHKSNSSERDDYGSGS